ncbi:unnamed protein product [Discosporangium mesarthrocarpum]
MCVNDVICQGAEPLFFLDYLALGRLEGSGALEVVSGVVDGCCEAGCALLGGETAEMREVYGPRGMDIAGFAVGGVRRSAALPSLMRMNPGDELVALPSSGLHANGFTLVRRLVQEAGLSLSDPCPFPPVAVAAPADGRSVLPGGAGGAGGEGGEGHRTGTLGEALLEPTTIYVRRLRVLLEEEGLVLGAAHITGGGIRGNVPRTLPEHLAAEIDLGTWVLPPVFSWLQAISRLPSEEMLATFNCGVGMLLVVPQGKGERALSLLEEEGLRAWVAGRVIDRGSSTDRVRLVGSLIGGDFQGLGDQC